jgi:PAS domain S-box-containing protein
MGIHDRSCFVSRPGAFSQPFVQALGRIQAQSGDLPASRVYVYDLVEQQTVYTSSSMAALLGYTADAIQAMGQIGLAHLIHPDDLNRVSEYYQQFATLLQEDIIAVDYRMKRADGTWCWLRSQETPLVQADDGYPLQILGMLQDLTPLLTSCAHRLRSSRRLVRRRAISTQRTVLLSAHRRYSRFIRC